MWYEYIKKKTFLFDIKCKNIHILVLNAVRKGSDKCYKNLAATWCTAAAKIWRQHGAPQLQKSGGNMVHRSCKILAATWCTAAAKFWRQHGAPHAAKAHGSTV